MTPGKFTDSEISGIKEKLKSLGIQKNTLAQEISRLRPVYDIFEELQQWELKLSETAAMLSREKEGTPQYKGHVEQRIRILLYQEKLRSKLPGNTIEKEIRRRYLEVQEEYWSVDRQMDQCRRSLIEDVKIKRSAGL